MSEIWRDIAGYEGHYQVSSHGRVKSLGRTVIMSNGYKRPVSEKIINPYPTTQGYPSLRLSKGQTHAERRPFMVHRLVAQTFLAGSYFDGAVVCHNDGDMTNNHVENLRWDTQSANHLDKRRHGTDHYGSRTHCKNKHEYTPANTRVNARGWRSCRACRRERDAARRAAA